ncbi:MAG: tetratricopeptide repeat protein [Candidatus Thorarchaeota archaeon]
MYKHYESSDRIFVDREEYIEWIDEALRRCKEKSVVLHLHGIGGIGKSSLLDHWMNTIDSTIRLDCQQYSEFFSRLNILAKGAVLLGIRLPRFDVLWQIRQRFVEGVEPVKEEGREWAKEVVMAVPFIGSLASIGSAIKAVGTKVTPKLKGKYSSLGKWLQEVLGKNHVERLLEILWKNPRHAEFLFLDALLEDLNSRKNVESPLLFLFDHFEYVDIESTHWRYSGRQITETELWCVFLSSLSNCVGVMASRRSVAEQPEISIEESELTELDRESCIELLDLRRVTDSKIQEKIVSVSGGNPFVIGTLCDMAESSSLSLTSVESLRSDTLDEVRVKTWRKLFNEVQDLQELVNRAGLLPYFNRTVMNTVAPTMNTDQWTRMVNLSFVKDRGDGTWVLHDLAKELVITELGPRKTDLALEISQKLEKVAIADEDYIIYGIALSVLALANEKDAADKIASVALSLGYQQNFLDELTFLNAIKIETDESQLLLLTEKGRVFLFLMRWAESEEYFKNAIELYYEILDKSPLEFRLYNEYNLGVTHLGLGGLYSHTNRPIEAEATLRKGIKLYREFERKNEIACEMHHVGYIFLYLGKLLFRTLRFEEAENLFLQALHFFNELEKRGQFTEFKTHLSAIDISKRGQAFSLMGLAALNKQRGKYSDAEEALSGALARFRDLLETSPTANLRFKGMALNNLGVLLRHMGKLSEAEEYLREALEIERLNVKEKPDDNMVNDLLAMILNNLGLILLQTMQPKDAEDYLREALHIRRRLSEEKPERYNHHLTIVLNNYGITLSKLNKQSEAEDSFNEALQLRKDLDSVSTDIHSPVLASILNNLGLLLKRTSRLSQAETMIQEAFVIAREMFQKSRLYYAHFYSKILGNCKLVLSEIGKTVEEVEIAIEELNEYDVTLSLEQEMWSEEDEEESTPF